MARVPDKAYASKFAGMHWCRGIERNGYRRSCLLSSRRDGTKSVSVLVEARSTTSYFAVSLATTNAIENLNGTIRRVSRNIVKRWKSRGMLRRWTAIGVVTAEKMFRRIKGYHDIRALVHALRSKQKSLDSDEFAA